MTSHPPKSVQTLASGGPTGTADDAAPAAAAGARLDRYDIAILRELQQDARLPSSAAMRFSRTSVVGFPMRV